jgi:probable addiction module antidote protein
MVKEELKPFDAADYLESDEAMAEYLTAALETEDAAFIADALGVIARAPPRRRQSVSVASTHRR